MVEKKLWRERSSRIAPDDSECVPGAHDVVAVANNHPTGGELFCDNLPPAGWASCWRWVGDNGEVGG